jgi:hypothetical protein
MPTPSIPANLPSNRKFGWFFAVIFGGLAAWAGWRASTAGAVVFGALSAGFILAVLFAPRVLQPLNRLWYELGILMGRIGNPIILGFLFFFLLTPIAIVRRLLGSDELKLRRKPVETYWIDRSPPGPQPDSFRRQF